MQLPPASPPPSLELPEEPAPYVESAFPPPRHEEVSVSVFWWWDGKTVVGMGMGWNIFLGGGMVMKVGLAIIDSVV